jgi:ABC-2 type transport system permease protein
MIIDGTDINLGNQISNYLQNIILDFYKNQAKNSTQSYNVTPEIRMLYNPQLKGAPNFVPGVMALILLIVCVMMTAIAIVKEKETGTMEILLVSPKTFVCNHRKSRSLLYFINVDCFGDSHFELFFIGFTN